MWWSNVIWKYVVCIYMYTISHDRSQWYNVKYFKEKGLFPVQIPQFYSPRVSAIFVFGVFSSPNDPFYQRVVNNVTDSERLCIRKFSLITPTTVLLLFTVTCICFKAILLGISLYSSSSLVLSLFLYFFSLRLPFLSSFVRSVSDDVLIYTLFSCN